MTKFYQSKDDLYTGRCVATRSEVRSSLLKIAGVSPDEWTAVLLQVEPRSEREKERKKERKTERKKQRKKECTYCTVH